MTAAQFVAYIPTVLADFSLESLSKLSPQDTRLLTDFLLVIDLDLLVNCFGEYILVYMYLQSYPYGRWESYLKPYIENKAHFIKGEQMIHYLDVARSALHQMRLGKDSFHVRMKNFVLLATLERKLQE